MRRQNRQTKVWLTVGFLLIVCLWLAYGLVGP